MGTRSGSAWQWRRPWVVAFVMLALLGGAGIGAGQPAQAAEDPSNPQVVYPLDGYAQITFTRLQAGAAMPRSMWVEPPGATWISWVCGRNLTSSDVFPTCVENYSMGMNASSPAKKGFPLYLRVNFSTDEWSGSAHDLEDDALFQRSKTSATQYIADYCPKAAATGVRAACQYRLTINFSTDVRDRTPFPTTPPAPTNQAPAFIETPGTSPVYPPVSGSRSVRVVAKDPDGDAVKLTWSALPDAAVRVSCTQPVVSGAQALTTCKISQPYSSAAMPRVTFTAVDPLGKASNYTMVLAPGHYVALGDSFSAGEGVLPYREDTNQLGTNMCHRSTSNYASVLAPQLPSLKGAANEDVTCSGGTVATMVFGDPRNGQPSQLDALNESTTLVTLTAGGNDARFAQILKACVAGGPAPGSLACLDKPIPGDPETPLKARIPTLIEALGRDVRCNGATVGLDRCDDEGILAEHGDYTVPSLHNLYLQIHEKAPNARIVVLLYPHLFSDLRPELNPRLEYRSDSAYPRRCDVSSATSYALKLRVSSQAMVALNQAVDDANKKITQEVYLARAAGVDGIRLADPRTAWASPAWRGGHGLCSGDEWINRVSLGAQDGSVLPGPRPESFHPNKKGQSVFAGAVLEAVKR